MVFVVAAGCSASAGPSRTSRPPASGGAQLTTLAAALALPSGARVGILPFDERGIGPTQAGDYVAGKVSAAIRAQHQVTVVERGTMEKAIWSELCRSAAGEIGDGSAKTIGENVAADVVVAGILTRFPEHFDLDVRAISSESGVVVAESSSRIALSALPPNDIGRALRTERERCGVSDRVRDQAESLTLKIDAINGSSAYQHEFVIERGCDGRVSGRGIYVGNGGTQVISDIEYGSDQVSFRARYTFASYTWYPSFALKEDGSLDFRDGVGSDNVRSADGTWTRKKVVCR